jgi:hypothetical protein
MAHAMVAATALAVLCLHALCAPADAATMAVLSQGQSLGGHQPRRARARERRGVLLRYGQGLGRAALQAGAGGRPRRVAHQHVPVLLLARGERHAHRHGRRERRAVLERRRQERAAAAPCGRASTIRPTRSSPG